MNWSRGINASDFMIYIDKKAYRFYISTICSFSPFVRDLVRNNQYWYVFQTLKDPNDDFEQLIKLINGFEIDISISNVTLLNEVSKILQIQPLLKATDSFIKTIQRTPDNNLNLLESYITHQIACPELINEIVSKWDLYETLTDSPKEGLLLLSVESLESLFSSENFSVSNEETFFELIIKIIEQNGQPYSSLFSYCDFTKLTSNQIFRMIEIVAFDSLPPYIVDSLEQIFIQGADSNVKEATFDSPESRFLSKEQYILKFKPTYDDGFSYNGIFHRILTFSSSVFEKYVELTCGGDKKRYLSSLFAYDNIEEFHWDNYSNSNPKLDFKNAWIMITLPYHKIRLEDYTFVVPEDAKFIKTRPKSWYILARNHNDQPDSWQKIEIKKNSNVFASRDKYIKTFTLPSTNNKNFYSQFKIVFTESQNTKKSSNDQEIVLCGLEFYGTLARI